MRYPWPEGKQSAAVLSFDFDAESGFLFREPEKAKRSLGDLEERRFGPRVGVDRILALLDRLKLRASFFIPGWTVENHLAPSKRIRDAGHEIGAHGNVHEAVGFLDATQQERAARRSARAVADGRRAPLPPRVRLHQRHRRSGPGAADVEQGVRRDARGERLLRPDLPSLREWPRFADRAPGRPRGLHAPLPRSVVHHVRGGGALARERQGCRGGQGPARQAREKEVLTPDYTRGRRGTRPPSPCPLPHWGRGFLPETSTVWGEGRSSSRDARLGDGARAE